MNEDEVIAAMEWIDSIDVSTADAATCETALAVVAELREWCSEAAAQILVRAQPPLCSIHCHTPVRKMAA